MIYVELFLSMFQIGLFSIGGGYAAIPLIQRQVVDIHGWLTVPEFTDIITIAEMTPGPIAINCATFTGIRVAGIVGALVSTFACVLPPCVIVIILAKVFFKYRDLSVMRNTLSGLRPAVVGMIASAGLTITLSAIFKDGVIPSSVGDINLVSVAIFAIGLVVLKRFKPSPMYIMAGASAIGIIAYVVQNAYSVV